MSADDPLLRATADGDPACPDGRALAAMGDLVRDAMRPPRPVDLVPGVLARLEGTEARGDDAFSDQDIDDCYDGDGTASPALQRLAALARRAAEPPRAVDLAERVRRRLAAGPRASARLTMPTAQRWRVWSTVVAGHVAALIALAVYQINADAARRADTIEPEMVYVATDASGAANRPPFGAPATPPLRAERLPVDWSQVLPTGNDLLAPRRDPQLRERLREAYGLGDTASTVTAAVAWLQAQQDPQHGRFGPTNPDRARDLAVQSLATLALLGEGAGDAARDAIARKALTWLAANRSGSGDDRIAAGLVALALVEGALATNDAQVRSDAEDALARLQVPDAPGAAGLGGTVFLALQAARSGGLTVPGRACEVARQGLALRLPEPDADAGALGLAAFGRYVSGCGGNESTRVQVAQLALMLPEVDAAGRVDPLGWFFATLAMREAGGESWTKWSAALRDSLIPAFVVSDGRAHVPAERVRFATSAGGDVFATSVAIIDLQAPYRYIPLAR